MHPRLDGFLSVGDEDFEASMRLNFYAAVRATRAAVAAMTPRGEGTIVNVVSVNATYQPDGVVIDYGVAKAALLNLAKALSQELGPKGIRITSVSPGQVATDLWLGGEGVAATIGDATGVDAGAVRAPGRGRHPDRAVHHAARGGDAGHGPGLAAGRQRHRRQLHHRRRPPADALSSGGPGLY